MSTITRGLARPAPWSARPVGARPGLRQRVLPALRGAVKATLDRVVALVALVVTLPVTVVIAAAIRLTDGGPAFFVQERIGHNGRPFRMFKFRSMCVDADQRLAELAASNEGAGPLFKLKHDPRVTPVGRILRRLSLDELPQLVNILLGDMSLVGPRPALAREVATYSPREAGRLLVRPGLTGLWQVSGRSDLDWHTSVGLDLEYVGTWTLWGDLRIIARTFGAVLASRGAY